MDKTIMIETLIAKSHPISFAKVEKKLPNNGYYLAISRNVIIGEKLEVVSPGINVREITLPDMVIKRLEIRI